MSSGVAASRELYVYWKTSDVDAALAAVQAAQASLEASHKGLRARALLREEPGTGMQTLMEVYTQPAGIDRPLQAAVEAVLMNATSGLRAGPRHTEVFLPR